MEKEDHTYQDGFEVVGDLSRKRDKEREVAASLIK
jgi:hypothetical protein